jgi:acyl-CoA hydrolase
MNEVGSGTVESRAGTGVHLDEWVAPEVADEHGYLRAGKILEWMDVVGVLAAARHCRSPVVTASVDGLELSSPICVGERVTMTAEVACTSSHSIGVAVSMRHGEGTAPHHSVDGYMTFVAPDEAGQLREVPQLVPQTAEEMARFREGVLRREFRRKLMTGQLSMGSDLASADVDEQARPIFVRELLKMIPRSFRVPWDRGPAARTRHHSYVHKIEMVRSGKLNFHGTLYGGTLMRWIETTANLSARAHLGAGGVRLVGLHGLTFIRPTAGNLFVHIRAAVVHTTQSSLTTLVTVQAEDVLGSSFTDTLRAFLTFAPLPERDRVRIPALECTTDDERALAGEVEQRLALQRLVSKDRLLQ